MKPQRIQLRRAKGFNLQAASMTLNGLPAVKVDRTTPWGNPCVVGQHGTRAECYRWFALAMGGYFVLALPGDDAIYDKLQAYCKMVKRDVQQLRGNNTACWCSLPRPGEPDLCHAAVLLELANL